MVLWLRPVCCRVFTQCANVYIWWSSSMYTCVWFKTYPRNVNLETVPKQMKLGPKIIVLVKNFQIYPIIMRLCQNDQPVTMLLILPESEAIWNKIVDFLVFASFLASLVFSGIVSIYFSHIYYRCTYDKPKHICQLNVQ